MLTLLEVCERAALPYHRWSEEEYHQMAQAGLLDETERVELIEGELIDMAPIGGKHTFLVECLVELFGIDPRVSYTVRDQNCLMHKATISESMSPILESNIAINLSTVRA
ncbi:MAG: Uma2 family endonuclease [Rhodocyclales bacterium]|nr:Uma2 family endonuclease [Rhodocyclales bacterium]